MNKLLKGFLKRTPAYPWWRARQNREEIRAWEANGRPSPPPHAVKERNLRRAAAAHGLRVLVETGTASGQMVEAMRGHFDRIYSIELNPEYCDAARRKFSAFRHIEILEGDSGVVLPGVVRRLDRPALFWLDGHYSCGTTARGVKDTPIIEELQGIFPSPLAHAVIIDDARCFGQDPAYPSLEELKELLRPGSSGLEIEVVDDAIHIMPGR